MSGEGERKRSPENLCIDLCDSEDEEPSPVSLSSSIRKRIKTEPGTKPVIKIDFGDDGDGELSSAEVEMLTDVQPTFYATSTTSATAGDDDEVELVGFANEQRLPHNRQNCPDNPFIVDMLSGKIPLDQQQKGLDCNQKCCDLCYCYVCDEPASDCAKWTPPAGAVANKHTAHCYASDRGFDSYTWKQLRSLCKIGKVPKPAPKASSFRPFARSGNQLNGRGPWAPDCAAAQNNGGLTKCRCCAYYSRLRKNTNELFSDWCHQCGRVAHETFFLKKNPMEEYKPVVGDIFLGEKTIPFHLRSHDPRKLDAFKTQWEEGDWIFNEEEMNHDTFRHALGSRPSIEDILNLLPVVRAERIPENGRMRQRRKRLDTGETDEEDYDGVGNVASWDGFGRDDVSAKECQALLIESECHRNLLQELGQQASVACRTRLHHSEAMRAGRHTPHHFLHDRAVLVSGDIEAKWSKEHRKGIFSVRLFVKRASISDSNGNRMKRNNSQSLSKLLALWFEFAPYPLDAIMPSFRSDEFKFPNQPLYRYGDHQLSIPPFRMKRDEFMDCLLKVEEDAVAAAEEFRDAADEKAKKLSLTSSSATNNVGGGACIGTGFGAMMKNYFSEIIIDDVRDRHRSEDCEWVHSWLGRVCNHRGMSSVSSSRSNPVSNRECTHYATYVTAVGHPLLSSSFITGPVGRIFEHVRSLHAMMQHLENIGYEASRGLDVELLEGLSVELLEFQRQSVAWALHREKAPGGVQSFFWGRVPVVAEPMTNLFFSPLLDRFRTTKPKLVRGGLICEQMGLGKTIISLALILLNPAPELPATGSTIPANLTPPAFGAPIGWDPDLDASIDRESHPKRGQILCRGTLVVCHVSLVGQWIDEAKSKLKNPGLVYPYHGGGRKRNPEILARNAIVVTTYATLSSDATYHAKKSGDADYCPPCEQLRWWRIICDESHSLKGNTGQTMAVSSLVADHKWCVTGTPMSTSIADVKNQLKFVGIEDVETIFRTFCGTMKHIGDRSAKRKDRPDDPRRLGHFTFFMRNIMMRHSMEQKYRGTDTKLMSLPPKTERQLQVGFSKRETSEYLWLEAEATSFYTDLLLKESNLRRYMLTLTQKLLPMRIACAGGKIPLESEKADENQGDDDNDDGEGRKKRRKKEVKYGDFRFTAKFKILLKELERIRDEEPSSKSLVFSQFSSTLLFLQEELPKHNFQFRTLSGDMPMNKRAQALADFQNDPPTTIFLLSMRAGACGINLTQANRVFLMEPAFNPGLEAQAIGRVYRLGQKRSVEIVRLVVKDSVETRMLSVLTSKFGSAVACAAPDSKEEKEDSERKPAAKDTTSNALLGHLHSDRSRDTTRAEFDILFGVAKPSAAETKTNDAGDDSNNSDANSVSSNSIDGVPMDDRIDEDRHDSDDDLGFASGFL